MSKRLLLILILCASLASVATAESLDSDIKILEPRGCVIGWVNADGNALIFVPGETGYQATFDDGSQVTICSGTLAFGETQQVFDFAGNVIIDTLGAPAVMCGFFPAACTFESNGVIRLDNASTGSTCPDNDIPSADWQELVAPDGRVVFVCRSDAPSEEP